MARIDIEGFDRVQLSLEKLAAMPDSVRGEMLTAAGQVIAEAHRRKLELYVGEYAVKPTRRGRPRAAVRTGQLAASIRPARPNVKDGTIEIRPTGSRVRGRTSTRNEEIGYILEYGKAGVPARPWMRDANAECEEKAADAAAGSFGKWLDEIGL